MSTPPLPAARLDQISTRWPAVTDPVQFTLRYAPAIRAYLNVLVPDPHEADEVLQDFLLRGLQRGFGPAAPVRGRFRDYLKTAVRNAARTRLRRRTPAQAGMDLDRLPAADAEAAGRAWLDEWRRCVLDRAWEDLEEHERRAPGNLACTALRLAAEHPEDSAALAARASALAGRPLTAAAFRKQLSRARRLFAALIVREVAQTLEGPTPQRLEEELAEVGLLPYVGDFLPPDWRETGRLLDPEGA